MNRNLVIALFCLISVQTLAGGGLLDRKLTVSVESKTLKTTLKIIGGAANVQFSYNPELIDDSRKVSLKVENKSLRTILVQLFSNSVRFKEVGNHIVLLKNENRKEIRKRKKKKEHEVFTGSITHRETGSPIYGASIYDVDNRYATLSDSSGGYKLMVPKKETVRSLYVKKQGFHAKVIVIETGGRKSLVNHIELIPDQEIGVLEPKTLEERMIAGRTVSEDIYLHSSNLSEINEIRWAQVSLVPSVSFGSNLSTNGLITNRFSLNVLAGYSKGTDILEIGGILNIVQGDVRWAQIGGITNLVGGNVTGFQAGGINNSVRGNFLGAQVAGISNINVGDVTGVQVSGISSIIRGGFTGAQIGGIHSHVWGKSKGVQISGIYNHAMDSLIGGQIAGIGNTFVRGKNWFQVAGIFNGAGVNNYAQIAGIFNYAKENKGIQIGLINVSERNSGVSLGLINFVKYGYHKTEIGTNSYLPLNFTFKSGTRYFYNTYHFGLSFSEDPMIGFGLGAGTAFDMSERFGMNIDLSCQLLKNHQSSFDNSALLITLAPTVDFKVAKWLAVYAGPTVNLEHHWYDSNFSSGVHAFHAVDGYYSSQRFSIGFRAGIRL